MKIRCGKDVAIDIDHVIGWKLFTPDKKRGETLALFFVAAGETLHVSKNFVGYQAFDNLHKLLLDRFPVDLSEVDYLPSIEFGNTDVGNPER